VKVKKNIGYLLGSWNLVQKNCNEGVTKTTTIISLGYKSEILVRHCRECWNNLMFNTCLVLKKDTQRGRRIKRNEV
jgi:hypothetical protein